jgi:hypothetical protein
MTHPRLLAACAPPPLPPVQECWCKKGPVTQELIRSYTLQQAVPRDPPPPPPRPPADKLAALTAAADVVGGLLQNHHQGFLNNIRQQRAAGEAGGGGESGLGGWGVLGAGFEGREKGRGSYNLHNLHLWHFLNQSHLRHLTWFHDILFCLTPSTHPFLPRLQAQPNTPDHPHHHSDLASLQL